MKFKYGERFSFLSYASHGAIRTVADADFIYLPYICFGVRWSFMVVPLASRQHAMKNNRAFLHA